MGEGGGDAKEGVRVGTWVKKLPWTSSGRGNMKLAMLVIIEKLKPGALTRFCVTSRKLRGILYRPNSIHRCGTCNKHISNAPQSLITHETTV